VDEGVVERSLLEYTHTADVAGTTGIDLRGGTGWMVRANVFRNIVGPSQQPAGAAVLVHGQASLAVTDGNSFVNCWEGIAYGIDDGVDADNAGGIIRNNMFFRSAAQSGDAGIVVSNSPYTIVVNNTIFTSGTFGTPIVYRYPGTHDVLIANNLLDGVIWARDGATGEEQSNFAGATAGMFADAVNGDLHLAATAFGAIDRGTTIQAAFSDFNGQQRPLGLGYDIGAAEYRSLTSAASVGKAASKGYFIGGQVTNTSGPRLSRTRWSRFQMTAPPRSPPTATGIYTFNNLNPGGDYTLTPAMAGGKFTPATRRYTSLPGWVSSADFKMTATSTTTPTTPTPTTPTPTTPTPSAPAVAPQVTLVSPSTGATYTAPGDHCADRDRERRHGKRDQRPVLLRLHADRIGYEQSVLSDLDRRGGRHVQHQSHCDEQRRRDGDLHFGDRDRDGRLGRGSCGVYADGGQRNGERAVRHRHAGDHRGQHSRRAAVRIVGRRGRSGLLVGIHDADHAGDERDRDRLLRVRAGGHAVGASSSGADAGGRPRAAGQPRVVGDVPACPRGRSGARGASGRRPVAADWARMA